MFFCCAKVLMPSLLVPPNFRKHFPRALDQMDTNQTLARSWLVSSLANFDIDSVTLWRLFPIPSPFTLHHRPPLPHDWRPLHEQGDVHSGGKRQLSFRPQGSSAKPHDSAKVPPRGKRELLSCNLMVWFGGQSAGAQVSEACRRGPQSHAQCCNGCRWGHTLWGSAAPMRGSDASRAWLTARLTQPGRFSRI